MSMSSESQDYEHQEISGRITENHLNSLIFNEINDLYLLTLHRDSGNLKP